MSTAGPLEWQAMKLAFRAAPTAEAARARDALEERYGRHTPEEADVIVPLGGDGFMLETLHAHLALAKPIYGMNLGTVGFLLNSYDQADVRCADRARPAGRRSTRCGCGPSCATAASSRPSASTRSRSTARAARRPSSAIAIDDVVPPARAGLRRHPGGDAGGLDRLQSLRPWADHPARPRPSWR